MQVGELSKQLAKKRHMLQKRDQLIQHELKKKERERVNLDQSSIKKGHIEKHKIIAKKTFETLVEKTKKAPI